MPANFGWSLPPGVTQAMLDDQQLPEFDEPDLTELRDFVCVVCKFEGQAEAQVFEKTIREEDVTRRVEECVITICPKCGAEDLKWGEQ